MLTVSHSAGAGWKVETTARFEEPVHVLRDRFAIPLVSSRRLSTPQPEENSPIFKYRGKSYQ